jgi:hypothetical protein
LDEFTPDFMVDTQFSDWRQKSGAGAEERWIVFGQAEEKEEDFLPENSRRTQDKRAQIIKRNEGEKCPTIGERKHCTDNVELKWTLVPEFNRFPAARPDLGIDRDFQQRNDVAAECREKRTLGKADRDELRRSTERFREPELKHRNSAKFLRREKCKKSRKNLGKIKLRKEDRIVEDRTEYVRAPRESRHHPERADIPTRGQEIRNRGQKPDPKKRIIYPENQSRVQQRSKD